MSYINKFGETSFRHNINESKLKLNKYNIQLNNIIKDIEKLDNMIKTINEQREELKNDYNSQLNVIKRDVNVLRELVRNDINENVKVIEKLVREQINFVNKEFSKDIEERFHTIEEFLFKSINRNVVVDVVKTTKT